MFVGKTNEEKKCLAWDARFSVMGTLVACCAGVHCREGANVRNDRQGDGKGFTCTSTILASHIPCTFDSGTILTLTDRGAPTTRLEFVGGVEALEIASGAAQAGDGACGETHRAQLGVVALRGYRALVNTAGRLGVAFLAAVLVVVPIPVVVALGRGRGGVVRRAAGFVVVPIPIVVRAFLIGRGRGRGILATIRKTTVLVLKPGWISMTYRDTERKKCLPELALFTVVGYHKGEGSGDEKESNAQAGKDGHYY